MNSDVIRGNEDFGPVTPRQVEDWHKNYVLKQRYQANIMTAEVELAPYLDVEAFSTAYRMLIERIDILRSSYPKVNGVIVQRIEAYDPVKFALNVNHRAESVSEVATFKKQTFQQLKEIRRAPLLKAGLFNNNNNGYLFVFFIHHIICDAWSISILKSCLQTLYMQVLTRAEPKILVSDYNKYFITNRQTIQSEHRNTILYWKEKLSKGDWHLDYNLLNARLAPDQKFSPRKPWQSLKHKHVCRNRIGSAYTICIDPKLFTKLQGFKNKTRFSTFNILAGNFALLSFKLTAVPVSLIQCTCFNRFDEKTTDLIGNLLGIVLLHVCVDDRKTVYEYMAECYQTFVQAIQKILLNAEELEPLKLTTRSLLCLNYIERIADEIEISPPIREAHIDAESPLYCVAMEFSNTIQFRLEYRLEFYSDTAIERLMYGYFELLNRLMDDANARITSI